jgi:hypothetical protein
MFRVSLLPIPSVPHLYFNPSHSTCDWCALQPQILLRNTIVLLYHSQFSQKLDGLGIKQDSHLDSPRFTTRPDLCAHFFCIAADIQPLGTHRTPGSVSQHPHQTKHLSNHAPLLWSATPSDGTIRRKSRTYLIGTSSKKWISSPCLTGTSQQCQ